MKSTKTLLTIVRDNLEPTFKQCSLIAGICGVANNCCSREIITVYERNKILKYLDSNKPDFAKQREHDLEGQFDEECRQLALFWWTPKEIKPRIKWLNEQINKL